MKPQTLTQILILTLVSSLVVSILPAQGDIVFRDGTVGRVGRDLHSAIAPYIRIPANKTYDSGLLYLYVSFHYNLLNVNYSLSYSLDGRDNESIPLTSHYFGGFKPFGDHPELNYCDGSVALPPLSNGSHGITVYLGGTWTRYTHYANHSEYYQTVFDSQILHFTIASPVALLLNNNVYTSEVPLNFCFNGAGSQISYSLDGHANVTIAGNTTLSGLVDGVHSVNLYVNDVSGNATYFDTVTFNVTEPSSSQSKTLLTPESLILVLVPSLVIVAALILLFLRKRNHRQNFEPTQNP